jgi:hypothetical protein
MGSGKIIRVGHSTNRVLTGISNGQHANKLHADQIVRRSINSRLSTPRLAKILPGWLVLVVVKKIVCVVDIGRHDADKLSSFR